MTDEKDPPKDEASKDEAAEKSEKAETVSKAEAKSAPSDAEVSSKDDEKKPEEKKEKKADEKKAEDKKEEKKAEKKKPTKKDPADAFRIPASHPVANAWKTFLGAGVLGIVGSGYGYTQDHTRFAYAWLFGFICALTLAIGSIMFVMMHHLANGNWGIVVRRVAEIFGASSWVLIILVIPVLLMRGTLFGEWLNKGDAAHAGKEHAALEQSVDPYDYELASNDLQFQPRGMPGGPGGHGGMQPRNPHGPGGPGGFPQNPHGGHPPSAGSGTPIHMQVGRGPEERAEHVEHQEVMQSKSWYLNQTFFFARLIAYFIIWYLVGFTLLKWSTDQDKTKDLALTVKLARFSAPGIVLMTLTLTFAAFDWIMSLDPTWYSTIFGVTFFSGSMVCAFATLIITFLGFRQNGLLAKEVTVEHYHDLGKLLFGFMCFWAYVCFSQFMLIWYASIPEEVTFYHHRWDGNLWRNVSLALIGLHFMFPFVFIMSRNIKRNLGLLRIGATLLLTMHVIDIYWLIMPNMPHQATFSVSVFDVFGFLGPVGIFLAVAFRRMNEYPILPVGDPRLQRSIHFVNA